MIYGNSRDRNITRLLNYLERWPVFPLVGSGSGMMQPVFIHDLVTMILRAAEVPAAARQVYDCGGAKPLSFRELVESAAAALGRRVRFVPIPPGLAAGMLRTANRLGLKPLREEQVLRLAEDKVVDNGRALRDLGVTPRTFPEGVALQVQARRKG
jgi:nucleoside-diphosphate-sugar epimerase